MATLFGGHKHSGYGHEKGIEALHHYTHLKSVIVALEQPRTDGSAHPMHTRKEHMSSELFDNGLATRREVLGDDYVQRSLDSADDFSMPMQELVTKYCWGDIWNRPGLERQQRSMINLAMISALNRPHELQVHVRGALRNGLTKEQIQEIFLQVAIYCGVPAALDSFRLAREVFADMEAE